MTRKPLEGVLVVAIEQAVAAPYATSRLADAGARVIKIERSEGDFARAYDTFAGGESSYFVWLNRGKESLRLDLKNETDRDLLLRIIAQADVVVQNLKPGSLAKMELDHATLRSDNPKLITCNVSGFGEEGPFSDLKAYDLIVQSETALCAITGTADGPARVGVSVCDIAAGMYAHAAILEALIARSVTGQGCNIDISLFDAIADWMNVPLLQAAGGATPTRQGVHHASLAPYGAYGTGDGRTVVFSVQNDREWVRFCEIVMADPSLTRDPAFADNMARIGNRAALDALIERRFEELGNETVLGLLSDASIAYGRLNEVPDLAEHPHLRRIEVSTPCGTAPIVAPPAIVDGDRKPSFAAVPALGANDQSLRQEFAQ
ncbi:L-carnitine dehydratase/bile acid-inducible protein F [Roseibium sp. TrichSKD4]|uniref:CaiB/BaiF CoA transferase family protein n=1 Tax=Roseibium sp. TrichSKD4 TaxID=744980 RepID=UPI0001E5683B|nr:CaiB/BaiF CoA-transferase family protein [Roseibium sp. TrichSKD4]EFO31266.1 L-carnitine dehydratase/bile acid-inducible protein F [Roseibium sp. TrichSKD4]